MNSKHIFGNERDVELLELRKFLGNECSPNSSILDIGPWVEGSTKVCAEFSTHIDTVDLKYRPKLEKMVKEQWVEDYLFADLPEYDFVICLSTLEHIAVTPVKMTNYREMQLLAVDKMLDQARRGVFLTFPYGKPILYKESFNNIDRTMVEEMEKMAENFKVKKKFLSTRTPLIPTSWHEISQREADRAANLPETGTLNICLISMLR